MEDIKAKNVKKKLVIRDLEYKVSHLTTEKERRSQVHQDAIEIGRGCVKRLEEGVRNVEYEIEIRKKEVEVIGKRLKANEERKKYLARSRSNKVQYIIIIFDIAPSGPGKNTAQRL